MMLVCLGLAARWFVEAGTRVGAYCIRPTGRPGTGQMIISGVHPFGPRGPFGGRIPLHPGVSPRAMIRRPYRPLRASVPFGPCGPVEVLGPCGLLVCWGGYSAKRLNA